LLMAAVATLPPPALALAFLAVGMGLLGMGNGSVFQLVPQRFAERVGIMTGIVGAAGGLGGFLLPSLLGLVKDRTGSFGIGFTILALAMMSGAVSLLYLKSVWRQTWPVGAAQRAGLVPQEIEQDASVYATNA
jgi:NNP family nitrate/nitrite transporter-like MFS transporter